MGHIQKYSSWYVVIITYLVDVVILLCGFLLGLNLLLSGHSATWLWLVLAAIIRVTLGILQLTTGILEGIKKQSRFFFRVEVTLLFIYAATATGLCSMFFLHGGGYWK